MGIRTDEARVQALSTRDDTLHGTFWFDLHARRPAAARIKRMIDVAGALTLIALSSPLMLLIVLFVNLTRRGPAIVLEERVGFRCVEFAMYRFAMRRFDALPQLFNVLEGTMSLVGPQPLPVSALDHLPMAGQMRRFAMNPGVTGLWQSGTTEDERLRLDRLYVNDWSLWLDLKILARTLSL